MARSAPGLGAGLEHLLLCSLKTSTNILHKSVLQVQIRKSVSKNLTVELSSIGSSGRRRARRPQPQGGGPTRRGPPNPGGTLVERFDIEPFPDFSAK